MSSFDLDTKAKIFIAGHKGMVGSAITRQLKKQGFYNFVEMDRSELDLVNQAEVSAFFAKNKPEYVFLAAAKVGGIQANSVFPADFIYQNLMIESNVIHSAYESGVKRLLFLGSSCIYPKLSAQPMSESSLLSGELESTNEPYALAKIAGIKLCESYNRQYHCDFRSVMPTNLYGPGDNYHPENSHVIPAMIRRFHEAKLGQSATVEIWGTGQPQREFLYVDDMAAASIHVMGLSENVYKANTTAMQSHINVGTGEDLSIKELAFLIKSVVGYSGDIYFNTDKPDGAPRKLLDVSLLKDMGWQANVALQDGLAKAYKWFLDNQSKMRES